MLKDLSSSSNIDWSMISKPLVESAKNIRTEQFPEQQLHVQLALSRSMHAPQSAHGAHIDVGQ